jgi:hypothetical protein
MLKMEGEKDSKERFPSISVEERTLDTSGAGFKSLY